MTGSLGSILDSRCPACWGVMWLVFSRSLLSKLSLSKSCTRVSTTANTMTFTTCCSHQALDQNTVSGPGIGHGPSLAAKPAIQQLCRPCLLLLPSASRGAPGELHQRHAATCLHACSCLRWQSLKLREPHFTGMAASAVHAAMAAVLLDSAHCNGPHVLEQQHVTVLSQVHQPLRGTRVPRVGHRQAVPVQAQRDRACSRGSRCLKESWFRLAAGPPSGRACWSGLAIGLPGGAAPRRASQRLQQGH